MELPESYPERHEAYEVLRYIRDTPPTEPQLLEFLGGDPFEARDRYDELTQSDMLVCQQNRWMLAPDHLSEDGLTFTMDNVILFLDEERYTIEPKVTWMPEDWELNLAFVAFTYGFFLMSCMMAPSNLVVSLWMRGAVVALYCILLATDIYAEIVSSNWKLSQKCQLFGLRLVTGLLLIAPLFFINRLEWR